MANFPQMSYARPIPLGGIHHLSVTFLVFNYNLTPLGMYNGLFQVYCIKPDGKSNSIQRG